MPYFLAKGEFLAAIEDWIVKPQKTVSEMESWRDYLLDGNPIPEMDPAKGFDLKYPGAKDHLYEDWLGWELVGNTWQKPQSVPAKVGWWVGWRGDPDAIIRRTLIEGIEASIGWDQGRLPEPGPDTTRVAPWPIDFVWSCPHPWMEGWVMWAPADPGKPKGDGRVTITFATPGNGQGVYQDDAFLPTDGAGQAVTIDPATAARYRRPVLELPDSKPNKAWGMHVVRARRRIRTGVTTTESTPWGELKISIGAGFVDEPAKHPSVDSIWVHAPSFADGGVDPNHV